MEKKLYLSPIQMSHVFGPSVTGFYRVSQKVSDVIPVLRLTPIATDTSVTNATIGGYRHRTILIRTVLVRSP